LCRVFCKAGGAVFCKLHDRAEARSRFAWAKRPSPVGTVNAQ